jgi:hypothetical protein
MKDYDKYITEEDEFDSKMRWWIKNNLTIEIDGEYLKSGMLEITIKLKSASDEISSDYALIDPNII